MIRIVSGRFRGRRIATPPGDGTRPAANAHRESVLNSLGVRLDGARVLDLFAGSGAFAIEALSRGAATAVMLEKARGALATVRRNLDTLGLGTAEAQVFGGDAYRPPPLGGPFDVVFVAPPYPHFRERPADLEALVVRLLELVDEDGVVVVQCETGDYPSPPPGWNETRRRRFGRTEFVFLEPAPTT